MSIWDVQLTGDEQSSNDYPVAKAGTYEFDVVDCKLVEYKPKEGSKIPNCAELDVQLCFEGIADGKDVTVFDHIYFAPNTVWKATTFAKCIKVFTKGMTPKDLANVCTGNIGKAVLEVHEYNEKKSNRVKKYLFEEEEKPIDPNDLPF